LDDDGIRGGDGLQRADELAPAAWPLHVLEPPARSRQRRGERRPSVAVADELLAFAHDQQSPHHVRAP